MRFNGKARGLLWLFAFGLAAVSALLLVNVEARYLDFIESLDDINVTVRWAGLEPSPEKTVLRFDVIFHNGSEDVLWVEAINVQLFLDDEYAGAYSIVEGRHEVPPGEARAIPLRATLWRGRAERFRAAQADPQARLLLLGRARTRLDVGGAELKVFYRVQGEFVPAQGPTSLQGPKQRDAS